MAFWRIQVSKGRQTDWEQYNPAIRPGEMIVVEKPNGSVCIKINKDEVDQPYKAISTIWDEDIAEQLYGNIEESQKLANAVQSAAAEVEQNSKAAEAAAKSINEKEILGTTEGIKFSIDPNDLGLNITVTTTGDTAEEE